jgi:hypothetical protein
LFSDDGRPNKVDEGVLAVVRELVIDLNRSIAAPTESSGAGGSNASGTNAETPIPAPENEEGNRRKNVFDLNELPPNDDDENEDEEKDI